MDTQADMCTFFSHSPKRRGLLQNLIAETSDWNCGEKKEKTFAHQNEMGGEV